VAVVAAVALRILTLGEQSFWYDEGQTVQLMHMSFGRMLRGVDTNQATPQVYYILAWVWSKLVGYREFGMRFLPAFAGVLTVPVAFLTARQLAATQAGVIAAALTASSPMLVWYSQEARAYSLMVLISSLSVLAFVKLLDELTTRRITAWALLAGLALWTHYFSALVVIPEAVWLLWRNHGDRRMRLALWGVGLCSLALLPQVVHQSKLNLAGGGGWIASIPLSTRLPEAAIQELLGPSRILTPVTLGIDLLVVAVALAAICRRRDVLRAVTPTLTLTACGIAIFAMLIVSGHDLLDPRNVLPIWMPLTVSISIGLASLDVTIYRVLAVLAMCAVGVSTVVSVDIDARLQRPQWRQVAHVIGQRSAGAVFQVNACNDIPLDLYLPRLGDAVGAVDADRLYVVTTEPQPSRFDVLIRDWYTVCSPVGKTLLPADIDGFRRTGAVLHFGQLMVQAYVAKARKSLSTGDLAAVGLRGQLHAT
jgi:4-amino-4-deoxy-L-arabinose transferase-like glycosyltransferase